MIEPSTATTAADIALGIGTAALLVQAYAEPLRRVPQAERTPAQRALLLVARLADRAEPLSLGAGQLLRLAAPLLFALWIVGNVAAWVNGEAGVITVAIGAATLAVAWATLRIALRGAAPRPHLRRAATRTPQARRLPAPPPPDGRPHTPEP